MHVYYKHESISLNAKIKKNELKLESLQSLATNDEQLQKNIDYSGENFQMFSIALYRERLRSYCMHVFLVCYKKYKRRTDTNHLWYYDHIVVL